MRLFLILIAMLAAIPAVAQDREDGAAIGGWIDRYYGYAYYKAGKYADALELWRPLAEQGDTRAQEFVGILYEEGHGVPQDWGKAIAWYTRAAEGGDATAQYNLGMLFLSGRAGGVNKDEAFRWLAKAAKAGDADAAKALQAGW